MNIEEIKDIRSCSVFINNLLNDIISGKTSKHDAMAILGKYTAYIVDNGHLLKNE